MQDDDVIINATGLRHKYGRSVALDSVSLDIRRGEVVCIIGANGAGKSTLLGLLGGMLFPNRGHVTVFGMDRWRDNFAIRKRSTLLFAEPVFGASPTPYEFLRFFAQIYGIPRSEFRSRLEKLADEMHMTKHLDKPWQKLSLGMMKKTGLIAAFLPDAELRIMDEPFAGGIDPLAMEMLYTWIRAARERGETIVFSTQVLEQAEGAADRILILIDGTIQIDGTPLEILTSAGVSPGEPRALSKAFLKLTGGTDA